MVRIPREEALMKLSRLRGIQDKISKRSDCSALHSYDNVSFRKKGHEAEHPQICENVNIKNSNLIDGIAHFDSERQGEWKEKLESVLDCHSALQMSSLLILSNSLKERLRGKRKTKGMKFFSQEVLNLLLKEYAINPRPSSSARLRIANQTLLTSEQVRIWFANRRARDSQLKRNGST